MKKNWKEELYKKYPSGLWAMVGNTGKYNNKIDEIKQFISDLRKKDMEALIEIMKDKFAPSDNFLTIDLIKDYYENN